MKLNLFNYESEVVDALQYNFSLREKEQIFFSLISHFGSISKVDFLISSSNEVSEKLEKDILNAIGKLNQGIPLQHITQIGYFRDLELFVNENVLIPRPETEELVSLVLEELSSHAKVLDLGTGSGCISLSIKSEFPEAIITGIDLSEKALEVAKQNGQKLDLDVSFLHLSMTEKLTQLGMFDILISNPPYIGKEEEKELDDNVVLHEPHMALFSDTEDPLYFYKLIYERALDNLVDGGFLFLELHENYSESTKQIFITNEFKDVEILTDLQGKLRFLKAQKA